MKEIIITDFKVLLSVSILFIALMSYSWHHESGERVGMSVPATPINQSFTHDSPIGVTGISQELHLNEHPESGDLRNLVPCVPGEAGFEDDDFVTETEATDLKPTVPAEADFKDINP